MALTDLVLPNDWPLPAFHFQVLFTNPLFWAMDTSFSEVSGIGATIEADEYREGGSDNVVYHLPTAVKMTNLVLKRGIAPPTSALVMWCQDTFSEDFSELEPRDLSVMLLDESAMPVRTWVFYGAYPVGWKVDSFNSTKNEVAIEEIELCYNSFSRVT